MGFTSSYHFFIPNQLLASNKLPADFWQVFAKQVRVPASTVAVTIYPTEVSRVGHLVAFTLAAEVTDNAGRKTVLKLPLERRQLLLNADQNEVVDLAQITEDPVILKALKLQLFNDYLHLVQPQSADLEQTRQDFMARPLSSWLAIKHQQLIFYVLAANQPPLALPINFTDLRYFLPADWGVTTPIAATSKQVALTFDDGPNPNTTPQVLRILAQAQIQATFFMVGTNVTTYPQLAKQVADAGHVIGNHTYDHPLLTSLGTTQVAQELALTDVAIYQATGKWPKIVRPPYGSINRVTAAIADRPLIQWTVDSEDWKSQNATTILNVIQQTTDPGAIILLHDIQPATVAALPNIISYLRLQGYQFVSIDDLIAQPLLSQWQYFGAGDQRGY
ncbi:polysaccharide deacetylase family protein [Loigolactobacillus zhaoyuanensis]|uniref:Polysaccharide deacetylase family protein n=1 Tax=Loigolactobacillus zhaoyuanensis TaxID=2486017 RepID=A0ABW8UDP9_9LACO